MPIHAKINEAFPPAAEVRVAEQDMYTLIGQDEAARSDFVEQYEAKLQLRALACAQGISVGRLDSVAKIRTYPVNRSCMHAQDADLLRYLGIRKVAMRVSQPPLRSLVPLGPAAPIPTANGPGIALAGVASGAGVALLRTLQQEFISIEIPGGKKIASLPTVPGASYEIEVSPNGRVAAIPYQTAGVVFIDTETGIKLWDATDLKEFYAWMPEIAAALASDAKTRTLSIIDFHNATITPHPVRLPYRPWVVPVSASPSRVLVGSRRDFALIEYERMGQVIEASLIREIRSTGLGVTSKPPTVMREGATVIFTSERNYVAIDLESGRETVWPAGDFLTTHYAKLGETALLVDSYVLERRELKQWVFDIEHSTLSAVVTGDSDAGHVSELTGRTGFRLNSFSQVWLGDEVNSGAPMSLSSLRDSFDLERQISLLEAKSEPIEPAPSARARDILALLRTAGAPLYGTNQLIAGLARDATIEAVGVYEAEDASKSVGNQGRRAGSVDLRVRPSDKPLILVLSSYEPVRWNLTRDAGSRLVAVLVSAYHPAHVAGAGDAQVVVSGRTAAYDRNSREYSELNKEIVDAAGKGIEVFQGRYKGREFSVGGSR